MEQAMSAAGPGRPNAKTVCVVEDDRLLSLIYSRYLAKEGYTVEVCTNGAEAWRALDEKKFDLVLLDLMLPDMNGLDLLKKLRADSRFVKTPCVITTSTPLNEVIRAAHSVGVEHVFPKSHIKAPQIVAAIKSILGDQQTLSVSPESSPEGVGKAKEDSWLL
jgi:two-component system sensor histidine kinase and response regulator WspE